VPVVAGELELGARRQLDLGQRDEIVEPGLAGGFLLEKPAQLVLRRFLGDPGKQGVPLAGAVFLERLEPGDEAVDVGRGFGCLVDHLLSELLDEAAFETEHRGVGGDVLLPVVGRKLRGETVVIPVRETSLEGVIEELRARLAGKRAGCHGKSLEKKSDFAGTAIETASGSEERARRPAQMTVQRRVRNVTERRVASIGAIECSQSHRTSPESL